VGIVLEWSIVGLIGGVQAVLIVRLKQCEHALADGCLERAFELARATDFRAHRRGQELASELAAALVRRGEAHAEAGRIPEASADCERASTLAGNTEDGARLRQVIAEATAGRLEAERLVAQQFSAARRQIDAGQLTVVQTLLAPLENEPRAEAMQQELAARRAVLRAGMAKASAAFESGDWQAAVDHLGGVCRQFPADGELHTLAVRIQRHVIDLVNGAIEAGRLDSAVTLLARLDRLGLQSVEGDELGRAREEFLRASEFVRQGDAPRATEALRRLASRWPKAGWIRSAMEQVARFGEAMQDLRSGPLGMMGNVETPTHAQETVAMAYPAKGPVPAANQFARRGAAASRGQFYLHVDGVGSFLVIDRDSVVIGPVSSNETPDVALLAGGDVPPVTISRADGDYMLRSRQPVQVNDRATAGRMLSGGERIALGPRCRFTFRRPSAASGTAVLDLGGARLPRGDVRQVILLDREILIGPGSGAHVRCDALAQAMVLQSGGGNGRLLLRSAEAVQVDGRAAVSKPVEIAPGAHVCAGPVSFVITRE